jgi:hypothetical protein
MSIDRIDGILNYCRAKVRFGVVAAINGNIRMLINRRRRYKNSLAATLSFPDTGRQLT